MDPMLEKVLAEAPDAIVVADREGTIRYWNRGAELIFGHPPADALGRSLDLIIPENLRARHWEGYRRVMATGETRYASGLLSSPGVNKDGARVSLEFSMILLRNDDGSLSGCASVMRDVTERRKKEKELQERLAACESRPGLSRGADALDGR